MQHVHFIAIGGAGMSGIAKVLLEMGYRVSGSDLKESDGTRRLEGMGAKVCLGHRAGNIEHPDLVVVSSAVSEDNEELQAARSKGIPVVHRGEMLAKLMDGRKGVSVAGAHGKTTTTSMIALVLEKGGLDPTVLVGGEVADFGGNAKLGSGEYLVAEADESDGSFLKLRPYIAVATNIDNDHLDYYGTFESLVDAFFHYISNVSDGGLKVLCFDDPNLRSMAGRLSGRSVSYGVGGGSDFEAADVHLEGWGSSFEATFKGKRLGGVTLAVPGIHNVVNSLAAIAVGCEVGLPFKVISEALSGFHGVQRRLQTVGVACGVRVMDDYAHHPTEIRTTLKAVKDATEGRVICIFQPHRFSRTVILKEEFGSAFDLADEVILLDVYPGPGEKPIEGVTSELIEASMLRHGRRRPRYIRNRDEAARVAASLGFPGDVVMTMGAGDVWQLGPLVLRYLKEGEEAGPPGSG